MTPEILNPLPFWLLWGFTSSYPAKRTKSWGKKPQNPTNKTHPHNIKIVIKKWKFCFQLQPFCTEYRIPGDYKKKETIKPIAQSQTAGYPISLSTSTIGLFLGSVLWYHVAIPNCPRKLAALLQLKIPSPPEAEQHTPLNSWLSICISQHTGRDQDWFKAQFLINDVKKQWITLKSHVHVHSTHIPHTAKESFCFPDKDERKMSNKTFRH